MNHPLSREYVQEVPNVLGMNGIEFVEFATDKPHALGSVLEMLGFNAVARHRSREVVLYQLSDMRVVVNAHAEDALVASSGQTGPLLSAVAFRVKDAAAAYSRSVSLGAWGVPSRAQAMELHIPAVQGPGGARYYFVDRWRDFSIFDVDFVPIETEHAADQQLSNMTFFGVVQYVGVNRALDWAAYYRELFGFQMIPDSERFGIMPKGTLMRSSCGLFLWQLVEPEVHVVVDDAPEHLQRIGLGVRDVESTVNLLKRRGIDFVEVDKLHPDDRGALTRPLLGSVSFELVHQP